MNGISLSKGCYAQLEPLPLPDSLPLDVACY